MTARPFLAGLLALAAAGCGRDFLGAPKRPDVDGYRAHATVRKDDRVVDEFELAVRGNLRREEKGASVIVWDGDAKTSFAIAGGKAVPRPFTSLDEVLPGHPLTTGFSEKEEAARRGIESYHRESDAVLSGHVCWIWRFEDKPDEPGSPSTSYWVAPDLHRLVMRVDREVPAPPGPATVTTTELTNVRVGADPELFRLPGAPR